jgi:hypothetical protein
MAKSNEFLECDKINKEILNKQDLITSSVGAKPEYVRNEIAVLKTKFNAKNCDKILISGKFEDVNVVAEKYQELDKVRIETGSYIQRNYRIIFGVAILLSGLLIVATIKKD